MSDFTSKYKGYIGIPNEGSGIRIYLENETDSVDYTTTGENLTDFLDNLYAYTHNSLDQIGIHINDHNNPHSVTPSQIGAISLLDDEIITGNKSFIGKIEFSNAIFNQNITLGDNYVFSGNGAGLTNVYIPNLVYTNKNLQTINGSLVLNDSGESSFISIQKSGSSVVLSSSENGSSASFIGINGKSLIIDTNKYISDINTAEDPGISVGWSLNNISSNLSYTDNNGNLISPNIAQITLGMNDISPREQYPISLGTNNSPWNNIICNNIIMGNMNSNNQSTIIQYSKSYSMHRLLSGYASDGKTSGSITDIAGSNFAQIAISKDSDIGQSKTLMISTNAVPNINSGLGNSEYSNDSMSLSWFVPNITNSNNISISFTNTGISPATEYTVDLGDPTHLWNKLYLGTLSSNRIELGGVDVSAKIMNAITELPSNVVIKDSIDVQTLSSGLSIIQSNSNNPAYTIMDTENTTMIRHAIDSNLGAISTYHDITLNKSLSLVTTSNICDSKNKEFHNNDILVSWQSNAQVINSIDSNNSTSTNMSSAIIAFSNYAIKPQRYFPIDLGASDCRWRFIYSDNIDANSITLEGNDLKSYIDKATSMDKFYELERRLDAGDTASVETSTSYTDSEIERITLDYNQKIDNIDLTILLTDEIKAYIDQKVSESVSGMFTNIPIVEVDRDDAIYVNDNEIVGDTYDSDIVSDLPDATVVTSTVTTLHEEEDA